MIDTRDAYREPFQDAGTSGKETHRVIGRKWRSVKEIVGELQDSGIIKWCPRAGSNCQPSP